MQIMAQAAKNRVLTAGWRAITPRRLLIFLSVACGPSCYNPRPVRNPKQAARTILYSGGFTGNGHRTQARRVGPRAHRRASRRGRARAARIQLAEDLQRHPAHARPRLHRPRLGALRPQPAGPALAAIALRPRAARRHRLPLHPPRRSRHRALGGRLVRLAVEGGCNAVASTFGVLGSVARKYAHKIPFVVKINHNELLTYPNKFDQILFGTVREAHDLGAAAVGATIYFGSDESGRQLVEIADAFALAHELGMGTILWCYLRNPKFKTKEGDMHTAADLTGQANHLGVTIEADIIKQKLPERNGGYNALNIESSYGKTNPKIYTDLTSDNPIDLVRYQVANCYMGRCGLINSGGESKGASDLAEAVRTAVINKRGGGTGLISGRKAFQRPMSEGIQLLNAIQDVYLDESITVA